MFRKHYKEAMNDIKPDEAFMESVIAKAKKGRPPAYARYTKYAAIAAAAVVIVSGTVISMPLWQRVTDRTDGVIIEETTTDTAAPENGTSSAGEKQTDISPVTTAPAKTADGQGDFGVNSSASKPMSDKTPSQSTSERSANAVGESSVRTETPSQEEENKAESSAGSEQAKADSAAPETENNAWEDAPVLKKAVMGESDEEVRVMSEPQDMAPYSAKADASETADASLAAIEDTDIPTPSGYYCTSATPRGYTFVNDEGAVITVTINYGGEEREPYIEEDGENIYAVFTSFGLSVTINASGADRESVEEIINSLR